MDSINKPIEIDEEINNAIAAAVKMRKLERIAEVPIDNAVKKLLEQYADSPRIVGYIYRSWSPFLSDRGRRMIALIEDRYYVDLYDAPIREIKKSIINYLLSYDWEYAAGETVGVEAGR